MEDRFIWSGDQIEKKQDNVINEKISKNIQLRVQKRKLEIGETTQRQDGTYRKIGEGKFEKVKTEETPEAQLKKIDIEEAKRRPKPDEPGGWAEESGIKREEFSNPEVFDKLNKMSPDDLEKLIESQGLDPTEDLGENLKTFTELSEEGFDKLIKDKVK